LGVGVGLTESLPGQQRPGLDNRAVATRLTFRGKQLGVLILIVPETFQRHIDDRAQTLRAQAGNHIR